MPQNLYETLAVERNATRAEIKKAYRKLTAEWHPDRHDGDRLAEERFKRISAAYEVLSDDGRRKLYDEFGEASFASNFNPDIARLQTKARGRRGPVSVDETVNFGNGISDIFRAWAEMRPTNIDAHVDFLTALQGGEIMVATGTDILRVTLPAAVKDGATAPFKNGQVILTIRVNPHPVFERDGDDITMDLPITLYESYIGAKIQVPTPWGEITTTIPQGIEGGRVLRFAGHGVRGVDGTKGCLLATVRVIMPAAKDTGLTSALERLQGSARPR